MFRTFRDVTRPPITDQQVLTLGKPYNCDLCSEGWSSETEVELHRSNSHSDAIADMMKCQDEPICKMCMKKYPNTNSLLCHIKEDHLLSSPNAIRVERDIFICSECGDVFFNKPLLIHHIILSHTRKTQYSTMKCPKCFKTIRTTTCWYHLLQHGLQSVAVCKICLTKYKDRRMLAEHMGTHSFVYKCDMCFYVSRKKEVFDSHIENTHKKPKVCIEELDDKWKKNEWKKYFLPHKECRTWQKINLMGWKGVRLTNDVHICVLCREICVGTMSMKRHIVVDHMKEEAVKPILTCSCGMAFTSKVLYKHHLFKFKDEHNM